MKSYFVFTAMCTGSGWPHLGHTHVIHETPKLRTDFVGLRAYAYRIVCNVELQVTLQISIIHCTCVLVEMLVKIVTHKKMEIKNVPGGSSGYVNSSSVG